MSHRIKTRRLPIGGAVWLLAIGAASWNLHCQMDAAARAQAELRMVGQERDRLAAVSPAPTEANARRIAADLQGMERHLEALRARITGGRAPSAGSAGPATPADVYFERAGYVARLRQCANEDGVGVRPEESFGFAAPADAEPPDGSAPLVLRQMARLEPVIGRLFAARPQALLGVRRERPVPRATIAGEPPPADAEPDYLEPEAALTFRAPGVLRAVAFRLEFTGQTAALRRFLDGLVAPDSPLAICRVEAGPVEAGDNRTPALPPTGAARFAVTLEYLEPEPLPMPPPT